MFCRTSIFRGGFVDLVVVTGRWVVNLSMWPDGGLPHAGNFHFHSMLVALHIPFSMWVLLFLGVKFWLYFTDWTRFYIFLILKSGCFYLVILRWENQWWKKILNRRETLARCQWQILRGYASLLAAGVKCSGCCFTFLKQWKMDPWWKGRSSCVWVQGSINGCIRSHPMLGSTLEIRWRKDGRS